MIFIKIIIFTLTCTLTFAQITKKELDDVPPVSETIQSEPVVISIGNKNFTLKDFTQSYRRSLQTDTIPDRTPRQYLDRFIYNQLLISKAEKEGIDTTQAFKEELQTIRKELASTYLVEKSVNDALIKEAYERLETEVNISHILISVDEFGYPSDTTEAYNKINEIRNRILAGEKFSDLARQFSNDESVKKNEGNLGYITAFQTVYPFESASFNTPVGKISMPFRTPFGYHIVKVIAKREYQRWKVAHIFVNSKPDESEADQATAKKKIDEIYKKLQDGENYELICRQFSEDVTTNTKGGVFKRLFGTDELEKPFEDALFTLKKNGSYSVPIRTSRGWHILRLIEKEELKPFSDMANYLQNKVTADSRSELAKKALLQRIKKENKFIEFRAVIDDSNRLIDSILNRNLNLEIINKELAAKTIFSIGQYEIKAAKYFDFVNNIWAKNKKKKYSKLLPNKWYDEFEINENINFEEEQLEIKNKEFGQIIKDYHESILIQTVSDQNLWSATIQDTVSHRLFFEKNKSQYILPETIQLSLIEANSADNLKKLKEVFSKSPYPLSLKWNDLIFPKNYSLLSANHTLHLTDLALLLIKNSEYRIEISGNIDPEESENISFERANNVVNFIRNKGILADRIIQKDNSKFQPISKIDREKNRRVSFLISTTNKQDVVKLYNALKPESLKVIEGTFKKGDNKLVDNLKWELGQQQFEKSGKYFAVNVDKLEPTRPMTYSEARGKVIKTIQLQKEKELLDKLKATFPIQINEDQLKKVSK